MKVLVLTSGGDAPGMNMVISSLYKNFKGKLYACRAGFKGLVNNDIVSIKEYKPLEFINEAGSVIKCSRCDAFKEEAYFKKAVENAKRFDAIVVIGGNGSLKGAEALDKAGVHTIFIPASIDNNIEGSEYSLGFHTAVKAGVETFRNVMPSFDAHERVAIFEVMGRKSDKIAKAVSNLCKPDYMIVSEEINYPMIADIILENKEKGLASSIIIKENLIDLSKFIKNLSKLTENIDMREIKVGYVQRGHKPTARDIRFAKLFAKKAIKAIKSKNSVKLLVKKGKIISEKLL